jgi:exodeoxyribonuclease III
MRLLTWNINSVRLRIGLVADVCKEVQPDIICLQETKTPDEFFPREAFEKMGYVHQHIAGMKGYNGVCILSKTPFEAAEIHPRCGELDCRHISAHFPNFELHTIYIPSGGSGGDEPDPFNNPKFQHKLDFVDEMADWFSARATSQKPMIAVGDFNIAPYENDVWSHKQLLKVISHTPDETTRLEKMRQSLDWIDASRHFVDMDEKCYTWWSYRNKDWTKSNRGRRLDHIWVTPPLKDHLAGHDILTHARSFEKPSDHVPVWIDLKF